MCIRLAHELSHSWFGLMIGPRDWTEEWLSEGFCTYTELYLHGVVLEVIYARILRGEGVLTPPEKITKV